MDAINIGNQRFYLGKLPPSNKPAILFEDIQKKAVPVHPEQEDYIHVFDTWRMLGNDAYGDCVSVAIANQIRSVTALLGHKQYYPTKKSVLKFYATQNPGFPNEDNGMDLQTALGTLNKSGWSNGRNRCIAFAKVSHTNREEMQAAASIFGTIILGIKVYQGNMEEFRNGAQWSNAGGTYLGGHAVCVGGYLDDAQNALRFVSWGHETALTNGFIDAGLVDEAWVVIHQENLGSKQFMQGVDVDALRDAYQSLTHRPLSES